MGKQTKQLKKQWAADAVGSGTVRDMTIAATVQAGLMTPAQISARSGLPEPTVRQIAERTRLPTKTIDEVRAALPANLYTLADACVDRLLDPTRLDECSASELVKIMTHAIHNARLILGESTANQFSLAAIVTRINAGSGVPPELATDLSITHIGSGAAKPIDATTGQPADPVRSLDLQLGLRDGVGGGDSTAEQRRTRPDEDED